MKKCKECALKHLRAAYAYAESSDDAAPVQLDVSVRSLVSRAYVLATEAPAYPDHFGMSVGTLVMAEEEAAMMPEGIGGSVALELRSIRLKSPNAAALALELRKSSLCDPFAGHVLEAMREGDIAGLPYEITRQWFSENFKSLERAVSEEKATEDTEGDKKEKGGEKTMACAKKAACKGGKCGAAAKKGAVKGKKKCCK